jgi:hypothetical protein
MFSKESDVRKTFFRAHIKTDAAHFTDFETMAINTGAQNIKIKVAVQSVTHLARTHCNLQLS